MPYSPAGAVPASAGLTDYRAGEGALREMLRACAGPEKRYTILRYLSGRQLPGQRRRLYTAMRERG